LGIENTEESLTARCLACGARFEVEMTNPGESTRVALVRLAQSVLAATERMAEVNRCTEIILRPIPNETGVSPMEDS
jgi:hypothetical protein